MKAQSARLWDRGVCTVVDKNRVLGAALLAELASQWTREMLLIKTKETQAPHSCFQIKPLQQGWQSQCPSTQCCFGTKGENGLEGQDASACTEQMNTVTRAAFQRQATHTGALHNALHSLPMARRNTEHKLKLAHRKWFYIKKEPLHNNNKKN